MLTSKPNRYIRERGDAPVKNYATSTSFGACPFKFSYNFYLYTACLGCKFCYKKVVDAKYRTMSPHLLQVEKDYNKNLFTAPIIISKYCDPLYSKVVIEKSLEAMTYILQNGGSVIFRSAMSNVPDAIYELASKYKDNFQYQAKVFTDDSMYGLLIKDSFCKKHSDINDMAEVFKKFVGMGVDSVLMIYPLIIGINDSTVTNTISLFKESGCKKVILHQLFATDRFKIDLSVYGHNIANMLNQKTKSYWTYDNDVLLQRSSDIITYCLDNDISLSFCNNRVMNKLMGTYNCCQFNNPKHMFDIPKEKEVKNGKRKYSKRR